MNFLWTLVDRACRIPPKRSACPAAGDRRDVTMTPNAPTAMSSDGVQAKGTGAASRRCVRACTCVPRELPPSRIARKLFAALLLRCGPRPTPPISNAANTAPQSPQSGAPQHRRSNTFCAAFSSSPGGRVRLEPQQRRQQHAVTSACPEAHVITPETASASYPHRARRAPPRADAPPFLPHSREAGLVAALAVPSARAHVPRHARRASPLTSHSPHHRTLRRQLRCVEATSKSALSSPAWSRRHVRRAHRHHPALHR